MKSVKQFLLSCFALGMCLAVAPTPAKADLFQLDASILNGPFTGTDVITGSIGIDTTTGLITSADVTVQGDSTTFTTWLPCLSPDCGYIYNSVDEYIFLGLGDTVGYSGGSISPPGNPPDTPGASYIYLFNNPGHGNGTAYRISGTLSPVDPSDPLDPVDPVPEPDSIAMALGMGAIIFVVYRRRLAPADRN